MATSKNSEDIDETVEFPRGFLNGHIIQIPINDPIKAVKREVNFGFYREFYGFGIVFGMFLGFFGNNYGIFAN